MEIFKNAANSYTFWQDGSVIDTHKSSLFYCEFGVSFPRFGNKEYERYPEDTVTNKAAFTPGHVTKEYPIKSPVKQGLLAVMCEYHTI